MRTYESVIVIDSLLKSEEIEAIIEKVERIINNNGGQIVEVDRWGKKRLAYEIKKRQYGYYVDFIFHGPGNFINVLEREYGLDENILRYLTVHLNKRALQHKERQKMDYGNNKTNQPTEERDVDASTKPETSQQTSTDDVEIAEEEVQEAEVIEESAESKE